MFAPLSLLFLPLLLTVSLASPEATTTLTASAAAATATGPAASSAAAAASSGQPNPFVIPPAGLGFKAGQASVLNWQPTTHDTVTLVLRSGNGANLEAGTVIAKNIPNTGAFTWTPDASITKGSDYALEIIDDANPDNTNYTPLFSIDSTNVKATATPKVTYGFASTKLATTVETTTTTSTSKSVTGSTSSSVSGSVSGSVSSSVSTTVSVSTTSASGSSDTAVATETGSAGVASREIYGAADLVAIAAVLVALVA
ncbi:hypothetical protein NA57DRAFT_58363 [Rhizodiscina lignyota]|uniref:Yeast cell wall synthesis Kre9/Knh1-like N-terminal domain-containing protein n=1 Tax=Rhizodiscina lignyota TaxID=1504668 RepID=A0A9P4M442_9PEZI|nr:hypothetical protein NA57DRAFT_58363 [Rhizodiscina lignyota]